MEVREILNRAADLIEPAGMWTQGSWARDAAGAADPRPEDAACYCLYGAVRKAAGFGKTDAAFEALGQSFRGDYISWNDEPSRTQAEVVAVLRAAAASVRA